MRTTQRVLKMESKHEEAHALMIYQCQSCGFPEVIWNSRDGVTPFSVGCPKCKKTMHHIAWEQNKAQEDLRIFTTLPLGVAIAFAKQVAGGKEDKLSPDEITEIAKSMYKDGISPMVISVLDLLKEIDEEALIRIALSKEPG